MIYEANLNLEKKKCQGHSKKEILKAKLFSEYKWKIINKIFAKRSQEYIKNMIINHDKIGFDP